MKTKLPIHFYNGVRQIRLSKTHIEISWDGGFFRGIRYSATRRAVQKALGRGKQSLRYRLVSFSGFANDIRGCDVVKTKTTIHLGCQTFRGRNAKLLRTWARSA
jgi:hypothetical protein